ncbi:GNAT family N-acetyltransferase [Streptomyces sp. NPDC056628]|uniref:GNAT family N-acetyltransferase n=1 Tax=Streptomyces sp. NPDC056628 TaxID=3345882 RepID=UPI0036988A76
MDSRTCATGPAEHATLVTRVAYGQWHALEDDLVVGRGHLRHRPDGRLFVSVDAWHDTAFARLAEAMTEALPAPLHTMVDEADTELTACWRRAGFTVVRREVEYAVPTDPEVTGLGAVVPPPGVAIVPAGQADEGLLREVDRVIRTEVGTTVGRQSMPTEVVARAERDTIVDPSLYAVATTSDRCLGLIRVARVKRPRIELLAVRAGERRRGVGRALLAHALDALRRSGTAEAWTEVDASNAAASALFRGVGARPVGSALELVR